MEEDFSKISDNVKKIEKTIKAEMTKRNDNIEKNKPTSLVRI